MSKVDGVGRSAIIAALTAGAIAVGASFASAIAASGNAAAVPAAPTQEAAEAITAAHHSIDAEIGRKDLDGIVKWCTADFRHTYQDGTTVLMPQYKEDTRKQFDKVSTIASLTQVSNIVANAGGATDTIAQHITAIAPYHVLFIHKKAHVALDYTITEQWVRGASSGWLLKASRTVSETKSIHL